jgi:hypothetical protein
MILIKTQSGLKKLIMACATVAVVCGFASGYNLGKHLEAHKTQACKEELAEVSPTDWHLEDAYGEEWNSPPPVDVSVHVYDFSAGNWKEKKAL